MGDSDAWIIECMPDGMIVLLNDDILHLCWCLRWFWNAFTIILNGVYLSEHSGLCETATSGWQLEPWFLPLCGCFIKLEIFGLFTCQSQSQMEGTRFPKVLSGFLAFFDLEDFALLGVVFIITVHWGLLPLLVQWALSCSQSVDHSLRLRKAGSCRPHIQNHLSSFLLSLRVTESKFALLTARQANESKRWGVEARDTTLFRKPADWEVGRLMSQHNHLVGVWMPGSFMDQRWGGRWGNKVYRPLALKISPRMAASGRGVC